MEHTSLSSNCELGHVTYFDQKSVGRNDKARFSEEALSHHESLFQLSASAIFQEHTQVSFDHQN